MKYYQLTNEADAEALEVLDVKGQTFEFDRELWDSLVQGKSLAANWKPVYVQGFFDPGGEPKDFAGFLARSLMFVNPKAWKVIRQLCEADAEALPVLHVDGREYLVLNVLSVVDGLDLAKSDVRYVKGVSESPDTAMAINKYCFKQEAIRDRHMFRCLEGRRDDAIVSEELKQLIEREGLTGARFKPLTMAK